MQVKSIAECSNGSILQYFRPSLSYNLSLRSLFCLFLSGHFTQVLLQVNHFPVKTWHPVIYIIGCWLPTSQHMFDIQGNAVTCIYTYKSLHRLTVTFVKTRKYHNHTPQTNPRHCEEEPHNTDCQKTSERQLK